MSIAVEFLDVVKQFPGAVEPAVDHVSFQIQEQEMITILGTSGCGKTTLMKMVNRLYEPTSGEIRIFGENIGQTDAVALRRKIGYVIQQVGLFPHMTVEKILQWYRKSSVGILHRYMTG
ncbi:MAG: ATP-binding cassette domain-containing protein [Lachnospiraceae bacterium]